MSRVLPAHIIAAAAVAGLCLADLTRLRLGASWWLVPTGLLVLAAAPRASALAVGAVLVAAVGWWWGSARLDALDHSPLLAEVDRAARGSAVVTAEPRVGMFEQRVFARVQRFGTRRVDELVQLELPLGRAPPEGARVSLLAVVRLPRGPSSGFDERTWLRRQGSTSFSRWTSGRSQAAAAASAEPAIASGGGSAPRRHPGSRENAARSWTEWCSATTTGSRPG